MSSRQKNKAKRMAKLFAKQRSRDAVEANEKRYNGFLFQLSWDCDLIYLLKNFLQSLHLNLLYANCAGGKKLMCCTYSQWSFIKDLASE